MKKIFFLLLTLTLPAFATYSPPLNPQPVSTQTVTASVTPTITASAYTTGQEIGGLMTFTSMARASAYSGVVQSIHVTWTTAQTTTIKLYLFNSNPSATTWTDKTTAAINASDIPKLIGVYTLSANDSGLGTVTINNLDGIGKAFVLPSSGTTIYAVAVVVGTPTPASTSSMIVNITTLED